MSEFHVCVTCLATNTKMHSVKDTQLQEIYEKLANVTFNTGDGRFETVCYICYSQLQKCYRFMDMSQRAGKILTQILNDGVQLLQDTVAPLNGNTINNFVTTILKPTSIGLPDDEFIKENIDSPSNEFDEATITYVQVKLEREEIITHGEEPMKINDEITNEEDFIHPKEEQMDVEEPTTKLEDAAVKDIVIVKEEREFMMNELTAAIKNQIDSSKVGTPADHTQTKIKAKDNSLLKVQRKYIKKGNKKLASKEKKNYECDRCGSKFSCKGYLNRHLRVHTGEKPFTCENCHKTFAQSGHLIQHMRLHTGEKPYECHICPDKAFNHRSNFKTHMKKHFGERSHVCDICKSAFHQKGDLKRHKMTHTGERPFTCNICNATFTQQGHLSKHVKGHTKEKPYSCEFRNLEFAQKIDLNNHNQSVHNCEKEYKCPFQGCIVSYRRQSTLANHLKVHKEERTYVCDKQFKQLTNLTKHNRIIHPDNHNILENQAISLPQNQDDLLHNRDDLQQHEEEYIIP